MDFEVLKDHVNNYVDLSNLNFLGFIVVFGIFATNFPINAENTTGPIDVLSRMESIAASSRSSELLSFVPRPTTFIEALIELFRGSTVVRSTFLPGTNLTRFIEAYFNSLPDF
jgi:hypothetical protein